MRYWGMALALFFALAGLLAHLLGWLPHLASPRNMLPDQKDLVNLPVSVESRTIVALGHIEPAKGILSIRGLAGDRVVRFGEGVQVGAHIRGGHELAELESYELRTLEVELADNQVTELSNRLKAEQKLADAKVDAAQLSCQQVESQNSHKIATQKGQVRVLEKNLALAELTLGQFEALHEKNAELVADTELRRYRLLAEQAKAELNAATALLTEVERTGPLAAQAAKAELAAAKAGLEQARAGIAVESAKTQAELARAQQKRTRIMAPCSGTVLEIGTLLYEPIGQEPILRMADLGAIIVVAEVFETDVQHIGLGQPAFIHSPAFPEPYDGAQHGLRGRVVEIGNIVSASSLEDRNPFAPKDCHIVHVRLALDDAAEIAIASEYIHLQVTVVFASRHVSSDPPSR